MSEYFQTFCSRRVRDKRTLVVRADLIGIHFTERC